MTESYLSLLEAASDPWALAFISFLIAAVIVLTTAVVLDPPSQNRLPAQDDDFFDKVTRYHHEL